jgi:hypothetical protein
VIEDAFSLSPTGLKCVARCRRMQASERLRRRTSGLQIDEKRYFSGLSGRANNAPAAKIGLRMRFEQPFIDIYRNRNFDFESLLITSWAI